MIRVSWYKDMVPTCWCVCVSASVGDCSEIEASRWEGSSAGKMLATQE